MPKAIVVGGSRTIGAGLVRELAARGWDVTGTVRGDGRTELHALDDAADGRIQVEQLDITDDEGIERLRGRCEDGSLDLLFINAGIADPDVPVGTVTAGVLTQVMITNALAPMHVVEAMCVCVKPHGTQRTLLLMDPGWVQTDLGGEGAPLTVDDSVRGVVTTIEKHAGATGLQFRDYQDHVVPW